MSLLCATVFLDENRSVCRKVSSFSRDAKTFSWFLGTSSGISDGCPHKPPPGDRQTRTHPEECPVLRAGPSQAGGRLHFPLPLCSRLLPEAVGTALLTFTLTPSLAPPPSGAPRVPPPDRWSGLFLLTAPLSTQSVRPQPRSRYGLPCRPAIRTAVLQTCGPRPGLLRGLSHVTQRRKAIVPVTKVRKRGLREVT